MSLQDWLKPLDLGLFPGLPDISLGFGIPDFNFGLGTEADATTYQEGENNTLPKTRKKNIVSTSDGRRSSDIGPSVDISDTSSVGSDSSAGQWGQFWGNQDFFSHAPPPPSPTLSSSSSSSFTWQQPRRDYSTNGEHVAKPRPKSHEYVSAFSPWQQYQQQQATWQQSPTVVEETPRFPVPPAYSECHRHDTSQPSKPHNMQQTSAHIQPLRSENLRSPGGRVCPPQQKDIEKWWNGRGVPGSGSSEDEGGGRPVSGRRRGLRPKLVIPPPPPPYVDDHEHTSPPAPPIRTSPPRHPTSPRSAQVAYPLRTSPERVNRENNKKICRSTEISKPAISKQYNNKPGEVVPPAGRTKKVNSSGTGAKEPPGDKDHNKLARPDLLPPPEIYSHHKTDLNHTSAVYKHENAKQTNYTQKIVTKTDLDYAKNMKNVSRSEPRSTHTPVITTDIPKSARVIPVTQINSQIGIMEFSSEDDDSDDTEEGRSTGSDSDTERADDSSTEVETETETEDDDKYCNRTRYHPNGFNNNDSTVKGDVHGFHCDDEMCTDPACSSGEYICDGRCTDPNCIMAWHEPVRTLPRKVSLMPSMPVIIEDVPRSSDDESDTEKCGGIRRPDALDLPELGEYHSLERQISRGSDRSGSVSSEQSQPTTPLSPTPSLLDSMHRRYYPGQYSPTDSRSVSAEQLCEGNSALASYLGSPPITHSKSANFVQEITSRSSTPRTTPERLSDSDIIVTCNKSKSDSPRRLPLRTPPSQWTTPFHLVSPTSPTRRSSPASFILPPPPPVPDTAQNGVEEEQPASKSVDLPAQPPIKTTPSTLQSTSPVQSKSPASKAQLTQAQIQALQSQLRSSRSPPRSLPSPQTSFISTQSSLSARQHVLMRNQRGKSPGSGHTTPTPPATPTTSSSIQVGLSFHTN